MNKLISLKIKAIRHFVGLTQKEFAMKVGLKSSGHVSDIEKGKEAPGTLFIHSICNEFKIVKAWLTDDNDTRGMASDGKSFINIIKKGGDTEEKPISTGSILSLKKNANQKYAYLHDYLEKIITSGDPSTIRAIESNLIEFHEKINKKSS